MEDLIDKFWRNFTENIEKEFKDSLTSTESTNIAEPLTLEKLQEFKFPKRNEVYTNFEFRHLESEKEQKYCIPTRLEYERILSEYEIKRITIIVRRSKKRRQNKKLNKKHKGPKLLSIKVKVKRMPFIMSCTTA